MQLEKTFIICNPAAGEGLAHRRWIKLYDQLTHENIPFDYQFTQEPKHATEIARTQVKKGIKRLAVFGGDGTMNETVQGIIKNDKISSNNLHIIYIPAGSSCDFAKKFPSELSPLERIIATKSQAIDLCKIECRDESGSPVKHYFINNSSIGVISLANERFNSVKGISKQVKRLSVDAAAVMAGLATIIKYTGMRCTLKLDGEVFDNLKITNITAFKTPYFGGGMYYGVDTIQDDGLISVAIVESQSRFKVAAIIPSLYTGKVFEKEAAHYRTCTSMEINTDEKIIIETDGESIGYPPAKYSILKQAVKIII
jgi:YegS/Rv2252/BmrU family lipid kinase